MTPRLPDSPSGFTTHGSGGHRIAGDAQFLRNSRRQDNWSIAYRNDAVDPSDRGRFDDGIERRVFFVKPYGDRSVAPGIVQLMTAIRSKHQLDSGPHGGITEGPQLVAGGG
jgi:hypothetical protein